MEIKILNIVYGSQEYLDSLAFRDKVFRKPWRLDIMDDDLEADKKIMMYGGYIKNELIGTVFLKEIDSDTAQIKAIALLDEFRGIGLGKHLIQFIEYLAREKGYTKTKLMDRVSAKRFYNKLGYKTICKPYEYKSIFHVDMEKTL